MLGKAAGIVKMTRCSSMMLVEADKIVEYWSQLCAAPLCAFNLVANTVDFHVNSVEISVCGQNATDFPINITLPCTPAYADCLGMVLVDPL
jgi:hypothetical protein